MNIMYEWVVKTSDGEEFFLTENQYQYYKEHRNEGPLFYRDFQINPSFISSARKRKALMLKEMYPCKKCKTNGVLIGADYSEEHKKTGNWPECDDCRGTGIKPE